MLAFHAVSFRYGSRVVLDDVSFAVGPGEVLGIIGPNGAGKTTVLRCANGLLTPGAGRVDVAGHPLGDWTRSDLARRVSWVPQHSGPAMGLTVVDMIHLGRTPHRSGADAGQRDRAVVGALLERLRLEPLAFRTFAELSGGERQRVLLARALAQEGQLLLLDEPTSALDLRHQIDTLALVADLARERQLTVVLAIHDLALAARVCDRVVMLANGRVEAQGPWRDVITADHVRRVFGVDVTVGSDAGLPYVIAHPLSRPDHR